MPTNRKRSAAIHVMVEPAFLEGVKQAAKARDMTIQRFVEHALAAAMGHPPLDRDLETRIRALEGEVYALRDAVRSR